MQTMRPCWALYGKENNGYLLCMPPVWNYYRPAWKAVRYCRGKRIQ